MTSSPNVILRGQKWAAPSGSVWTVQKRRTRASGLQENLLVSENGARKWLTNADVHEQYTPHAD